MRKSLLIFFISIIFSCAKDDSSSSQSAGNDCQNDQSKRRGALCKDGTMSTATGQGACSGHVGVERWLCK